jgi:hypothetical protein
MAVRAVSPLGLAGLTRTPSRIAAGDSGLAHVQTKPVTASLNLPNASHALEMMKEAFGAYRAVVADLSDAEKSRRGTKSTRVLSSLKVSAALRPNSNL